MFTSSDTLQVVKLHKETAYKMDTRKNENVDEKKRNFYKNVYTILNRN